MNIIYSIIMLALVGLALTAQTTAFATNGNESKGNATGNLTDPVSDPWQKLKTIEQEYNKLAHQCGAVIQDIVRIERAEESRFLFEDADFSFETIKKLIAQGIMMQKELWLKIDKAHSIFSSSWKQMPDFFYFRNHRTFLTKRAKNPSSKPH